MNCKFCQHPLEEGNSVCPGCGKDNAEEIVMEEIPTVVDPAVQENVQSEPTEIKEGIKMTPGKLALTIVGAVLLVAVIVALILHGMGAELNFKEPALDETNAPVETVAPATIPADGNPDDVTCKGSYSVSDEEAREVNTAVVATMGEDTLTNGQLQIYYWMQVQQFLSEYSAYASYFGLDYTQPLDTQICTISESSMTWQQYFLQAALDNWHNYQCLSNESLANGYEIDPVIREDLDVIADTLAADAAANGFDSAESWVEYNVGPGATIADYQQYLEMYYQGYSYFADLYNRFVPTEEDLETFFNDHAEDYAESGITKDTSVVDVRHVLVMPEGATSANIRTETFSEEAWAWAQAKAEELLEQWKAGEATEETFAELANQNSSDSDGTDGGLYTQVPQGQMVEAFDTWIFDEARQYGDVEIVKTEFGYHIMFFVSRTPEWKSYAESDYISERVAEFMANLVEEHPYTADYSAIKLGVIALG